MDTPVAYINLGDSMTIDLYPYLDLTNTAQSLAQDGSLAQPVVSKFPSTRQIPQEVGAASILFSNPANVWPEFEKKDLRTFFPALKFVNLAEDGATTYDYLDSGYLNFLKPFVDEPVLITITLGGNDLLNVLMKGINDETEFEKEVRNITKRYDEVLGKLLSKLPRAICILNTIYDPTDGTGVLPGFSSFLQKLKFLTAVNDHIKRFADENGTLFADVHRRFLGHGLSAAVPDQWYWKPSPIEPSARGASELRKLWLEVLAAEELIPHEVLISI